MFRIIIMKMDGEENKEPTEIRKNKFTVIIYKMHLTKRKKKEKIVSDFL